MFITEPIIKKIFLLLEQGEFKYPIKLIFANGKTYQNLPGKVEMTIIFKRGLAEWAVVFQGHVGFVEAYMKGWIDIEGKDALRELVRMSVNLFSTTNSRTRMQDTPLVKLKNMIFQIKTNNTSFQQTRRNQEFHYDLPAEFFHLMLGDTYGYTEGYYENGNETLDEAQHKKYDYICKKLRLEKGNRLIEVGGAYGYMSVLAAEKYGAEVVNYGLAHEQNRIMQALIDKKGLNDKVKIVNKDHRELKNEPNTYDRFVSIGVHECAGKDCQRAWIESIAVALKPGGIGLISCCTNMNTHPDDYLINKYIFPGGYIPVLAQMLELLEEYGLTVVDTENLRLHYARTMEEWYRRFNEHWSEIQKIDPKIFTESFRKIWSVWLCGSFESFRAEHDRLNLSHITFTKGKNKDYYPLTRDFLYQKGV